jgi:hypothetical protein
MSRLIEGTTTATFIKLACSAHDYSQASTDELLQLTELEDIRQTALVSKITRTDDALVDVLAALDNSGLTEGYYIRVLGLYAQDGDGTEILYGVCLAEDGAPDYMPAFGEKAVTSITYHVITKVGISANVTLEINPAAYPTMEQMESVEQDVSTIKDQLDGIKFSISENGCLTVTYDDET